jgi:predicted nucleic acid-binding protein
MRVYYDPSLLVALYLPEIRTGSLRAWVAACHSVVGLNVWQELEFRNAARQKVMRGEAKAGDLARTFRIFEDDCVEGRIMRRNVSWEAVFTEAERLSHKFALTTPCRAFDLLHVAIAKVSHLNEFATLDADQAKLAEAAGLALVDLPA